MSLSFHCWECFNYIFPTILSVFTLLSVVGWLVGYLYLFPPLYGINFDKVEYIGVRALPKGPTEATPKPNSLTAEPPPALFTVLYEGRPLCGVPWLQHCWSSSGDYAGVWWLRPGRF